MAQSKAANVTQIVFMFSFLATITLCQFQASAGSASVEAECPNSLSSSHSLSNSLSWSAPSLLQVQKHAVKEHTEVQHTATRSRNKTQPKHAPCQCERDSQEWAYAAAQAAREPRCIFIDLGAANGNTFERFLAGDYGINGSDGKTGSVNNCPSGGAWHAILVEANPRFNSELQELQKKYPDAVTSLVGTAGYMCPGTTSFFLDDTDEKDFPWGRVATNYWGSSMSPNGDAVQASGLHNITVPLVNVMRLIAENAIPEDYVIVKMDIEGSEYDIIPCLAQSSTAKLVDAMYVEKHNISLSMAGATPGKLQKVLKDFEKRGMFVPAYASETF